MIASRLALLAGLCVGASLASAQVVINEVYSNPPGSGSIDDRWEYVELYGPPGMSLNGWALAVVSGGQDPNDNDIPGPLAAGDPGEEMAEFDEVWTLDGLTIGANGLLCVFNDAGSDLQLAQFNPLTARRSFVASHIPTVDTAGRIINDGSVTYTLVRRRPAHALTLAGASLYGGTTTPDYFNTSNPYSFRKDAAVDVDFDGKWDFNGIATFVIGGLPLPPETPVDSEGGFISEPVNTIEVIQVVDDVAVSHEGGKEYTRSSQQEIADTPGFNPDALTRVNYFGSNPQRGHRFNSEGEVVFTRMADEEFIYGDIPSVTTNAYGAGTSKGPTDPNGPTYNELGVLDPAGEYLFDDIFVAGFRLTPGNFNDFDLTSLGGSNITQFRFLRGDFNFDGVVDCDDKALIEAAAANGYTLDDTEVVIKDRDTAELEDDITYTAFRWEGREFNGVLAMIRMNLADGSTGEWTSGQIVQGGQIVAWGGSVTQSDLDTFNAEFELDCTGGPTCPACAADYDDNGGVDGGDLGAFFADFEAGESCADVDGNGGVDGGDLGFFFAVFEAGGC
jgi:hypothetical protein